MRLRVAAQVLAIRGINMASVSTTARFDLVYHEPINDRKIAATRSDTVFSQDWYKLFV